MSHGDGFKAPLLRKPDISSRPRLANQLFYTYFAQVWTRLDFWFAAIEIALVIVYGMIQFKELEGSFLYASRALLILCAVLPCAAPRTWEHARHNILAADRIATVAGNLLMLLVHPNSQVGNRM